MRIKQSVCVPMFARAGMTLDTLFAKAKGIGFAAVETWGMGSDFDAFCATAAKHGLKVASFIGGGSCAAGFNDPAAHEELLKEFRAAIDVAAHHGVRGIVAFSGNRRAGLTDEQGIENTAKGLKRIAPHAEKKGVLVNLELLNSKVDHQGYQCDRTAWAVETVKRVGSPNVRVLYDIYHMQIMEGDIIRTIRDNIAWIGHFHTAGNPGRHEMNDNQEMNYAGICAAIAKTSYDGYVGHEFACEGDVIEGLKDAFARCDRR